MTSETNLTEEFFRVFGIERKCNRETFTLCVGSLSCNDCKSPCYPQITSDRLLEIESVILNNNLMLLLKSRKDNFEYIVYEKYKEVGFCERQTRKEALLQLAINIQNGYTSNGQEINYKRDIKQQIQQLFKEDNQ